MINKLRSFYWFVGLYVLSLVVFVSFSMFGRVLLNLLMHK